MGTSAPLVLDAAQRELVADEQWRILRVGACLACHAGDSPVMTRALRDFEGTLARRTPRCAVPAR